MTIHSEFAHGGLDDTTAEQFTAAAMTLGEDRVFGVFDEVMNLMSRALDEMRQGSFARGMSLALKSADECRKIGVPEYEAYSLTHAAVAADATGDRAEAIKYVERAESISREAHHRASALNQLSVMLLSENRGKEAIDKSHAVLKVLDNANDDKLKKHMYAVTLYNIGEGYMRANDSENAEQWITKALKAFEREARDDGIAKCKSGLGSIRFSQQRYQEAVNLFVEAKLVFETFGATEEIANTLMMLGVTLMKLGSVEQAREALTESKRRFRQLGDVRNASQVGQIVASLSD